MKPRKVSRSFLPAALRVTIVLGLVASGLALDGRRAGAAPGESQTPIVNPDLQRACGIDIHVILDESGSVKNYRSDVQRAFRSFTGALKNTGSRLAVSEFSTVARLPLAGAAQSSYTPVTDATVASTFEPYISNGYNPNGSTNWEDAFRIGRYFLPRPSAVTPHLVVFITDGNPNRQVNNARVTYDPGNPSPTANEYENKVPLADSESSSASQDAAAGRAVANANALKAQGSHVLAVAVGDGLSGTSALNRLERVSGPDVYDGTGTFDIATTDVYRESDFSRLEAALRSAAFQLCAPSLTVRKLVDLTPDTGVADAVPGPGYGITANVAPQPTSWILPTGATGTTATTTTDVNGFGGFQWNTSTGVASSVTVTEQDPGAVVPGLTYDPSLTTCSYRTPDLPDTPLATSPVSLGFTATVPFEAIVTCTIYNRLVETPAIDIEKHTNGADADQAPGPTITVGSPVAWDYVVSNGGNVTLSNLQVIDDQGVAVSCPASTLAPGGSITCTGAGTAVAGEYANLGTVTATTPSGQVVTDTDPSHYFGATPAIDIEKATNGQDADTAPGPYVEPGSTVNWTYVVTNIGATDLTSVSVTDDRGVVVTCPQTDLAPSASMTCTASGTAQAGQYVNTATAVGTAGPTVVRDSDESHYFGEEPEVGIIKYTNGDDADMAPGPIIQRGDPVAWTYVVTNTGNVPLDIAVTDSDPGVVVDCPSVLIQPGGSTVCGAIGVAQVGQYSNVGTVVATTPSGTNLTTSDPSNYFGSAPSLDIEKSTNGVDADAEPGPIVPVGSFITWNYTITNNGNVPLTDLQLADASIGPIPCPATSLAPSQVVTCTATGTAIRGQYANDAAASATDPLGGVVGDSDPSHYFGAQPGLHIEKSTNGDDADDAPGPFIPVGGEVDWVYEVLNTSNTQLSNITVVDDKLGSINCPTATLAPSEKMTCTATGTAVRGQYMNTATAAGTDPNGSGAIAVDASHYFGYETDIAVVKRTNGDDANNPTGPYVAVGGSVEWTYEVRNTGDIAIASFTVTDSDPSVTDISCPATTIQPGDFVNCRAVGTARAGQYENTATVAAIDVLENELVRRDPSHYFGATPAIDIEKATNGQDADTAPGPTLAAGQEVTWTYVVTNTGDADLTSVVVTDDRLGTITCPATALDVSASMTCTATGSAERGQYTNVGSVTAQFRPTNGAATTVTDRDVSHYLGAEPETTPDEMVVTDSRPPGPQQGGDLAVTGARLVLLALVGIAVTSIGLLVRRRSYGLPRRSTQVTS